MIWTAAYLASVVAVNWSFLHVPMIHVGPVAWSIGSVIVGGVFVLRDCAQRSVGHRVLAAMAAGLIITAWMSPALALASGGAFAAGETAEWVLFTVTGRPFRERVLLSASVATVIDTLAFLLLAGFFTPANFAVMVASKLVALLVVPMLPDPMVTR